VRRIFTEYADGRSPRAIAEALNADGIRALELRPAAVARYLAAVEDLAGTLSRRMVDGGEEIAGALRELMAAVVIHPDGKHEPRIEVTGRLAKLTDAPDLFPQQTLGATAVAGAGIEPATYGL
jgi:hypothetical protein